MDENMKIVIVLDLNLGKGLAANRAAVLATGLASHIPNMIGENLTTADGKTLLGFTQVPIPILASKPETSFHELLEKSEEMGCRAIVFLGRAQGMRDYQEYKASVAQANYSDLDIDAIAIWGESRSVTRLTGNLPALR